jgi:hypothetical protein
MDAPIRGAFFRRPRRFRAHSDVYAVYFSFRLSKVAGFLPHPKLRDSSAVEPGNQHVREQNQRKYRKSTEKNGRYI